MGQPLLPKLVIHACHGLPVQIASAMHLSEGRGKRFTYAATAYKAFHDMH